MCLHPFVSISPHLPSFRLHRIECTLYYTPMKQHAVGIRVRRAVFDRPGLYFDLVLVDGMMDKSCSVPLWIIRAICTESSIKLTNDLIHSFHTPSHQNTLDTSAYIHGYTRVTTISHAPLRIDNSLGSSRDHGIPSPSPASRYDRLYPLKQRFKTTTEIRIRSGLGNMARRRLSDNGPFVPATSLGVMRTLIQRCGVIQHLCHCATER